MNISKEVFEQWMLHEFFQEIAEEITRLYLMDCYETCSAFPKEPDYEKTMKAFKRVIKYVSTPDQYKEFKNGDTFK